MPRRTNAGRYRHQADIYTWSETVDAGGGDTGSFADSTNDAWGLLRPVRASELERAQLNEAQVQYVFETRYNTNITAKARLTINSVNYHVVGPPIDKDEMHREMKVMLRQAPV